MAPVEILSPWMWWALNWRAEPITSCAKFNSLKECEIWNSSNHSSCFGSTSFVSCRINLMWNSFQLMCEGWWVESCFWLLWHDRRRSVQEVRLFAWCMGNGRWLSQPRYSYSAFHNQPSNAFWPWGIPVFKSFVEQTCVLEHDLWRRESISSLDCRPRPILRTHFWWYELHTPAGTRSGGGLYVRPPSGRASWGPLVNL